MVVVFGRPGAGKTTVSNKAYEKIQNEKDTIIETNDHHPRKCLLLDLDVCVPTWMRDNFAKGIYPTLEQRREFATSACDYIDKEMDTFISSAAGTTTTTTSNDILAIISFSFVNTDLREYFISRFPQARWALVDVNDSVAQDRINQREGHFYKGAPQSAPQSNNNDDNDAPMKGSKKISDEKFEKNSSDNSEWDFAPVDFDHVILNGLDPVEKNAGIVINMLVSSS